MKNLQTSEATEWRKIVAHGATVGFVVKPESAPERGERNVWRLIFCRPFRGLGFLFAIQPTVAPRATFCRASGALAALVLFFAGNAITAKADDVSAIIQGRQLAQQLVEQRPTDSSTITGVLKIRDAQSKTTEIPIKFEAIVTATNWFSVYEASFTNGSEILKISHPINQSGKLEGDFIDGGRIISHSPDGIGSIIRSHSFPTTSRSKDTPLVVSAKSFAGSDFSVDDLSLKFFHWSQQKVLPKTTNLKRGREYTLLESTNPSPSTNGYSRVLSWIDKESGGILQAEAYDAQGKLLKVFEPKSFKKVNGQWELQEMEIRNVQTGSRTRLEFDLKK